MGVSGACALVWQVAWTSGLALALGHELAAVLAVMGAFFGGLAAGAFLLSPRIERTACPGRWYAALEAVIALWGAALVFLLPLLSAPLARWLGPSPPAWLHAGAGLLCALVLLLPATLAMGATLPALERQLRATTGGGVPLLYAANTGGALAGVLLAVFVALPMEGLRATALATAAVQLACAAVAWVAWRQPLPEAAPVVRHSPLSRHEARLFATGLLGIAFEVLAVRVLSQVCENTVYTYGLVLAVFLAGTAGGAALCRRARGQAGVDVLLLLLAAAVLLGGASLWGAQTLVRLPSAWFGPGFATAIAGEALAAAAALLPASLAMGALFAVQCGQAVRDGVPLARAIGWNTLGCALAPALAGAVAAPLVGAKPVLALIAAGYLALLSAGGWQLASAGVLAASTLGLAVLAPSLRVVDVPPGGRVLSHQEGRMAAVSVVADADGVARLHINNRVQEGSSAGGLVETRLAQLPLLLHGKARTALFLGLGTGYTAHAAAADSRVQVRAVELLPEVVRASDLFMLRPTAPRASHPVEVVTADARRFVQTDAARYDVVVADLFHPARSGAASLYTVEHFRAVRERLAPDGLFCQWVALHQMDLDTLRSIVAGFLEVYPQGIAVLAGNSLDTPVVGLVARPDRPRWKLPEVRSGFESAPRALAAQLKVGRIDNADAVLGSVLADAASLRQFARGAAPNTDDLPVVAHRAAQVGYAPRERPRERLEMLLHALPAAPAGALDPADPEAAAIQAYWHARDRYLLLGLHWEADADPRSLLVRAGPDLLELVRRSPRFQPAADALTGLAQAVQGTDYPLAQQVLAQLREAQGLPPAAAPADPSIQRKQP